MAKRKSKTSRLTRGSKKHGDEVIDERIRQLFPGLILGLEQKISAMSEELINIKGNLITTTSLLEKHKVISEVEFFAEFQKYMNNEGLVDLRGKMDGAVMMTIYNEEV